MSDDDYLWDKSGSDPGTERLERTLRAMAFDRAPPALTGYPARRSPFRFRGRAALGAALAAGVVAGVWAWVAASRPEAVGHPRAGGVPVVVLARDVPAGTPLTREMLAQRWVPARYSSKAAVNPELVVYALNQHAKGALLAGDPLLWSQLETPGVGELVSRLGRARAFTLQVAGVLTGSQVDVLGMPSGDAGAAVTLLQGVSVLGRGERTVSLAVTPEEAQVLVLAEERGPLRLENAAAGRPR